MPTYVCPECDERVTTAAPPAGKKIDCPMCRTAFAPPAAAPVPAAKAKPKPADKPAAAAIPFKPEPPPPPPPADDDEDVNPYGVLQETEEERRLAEVNKPKFGAVKDKFKKSKRGPAMALLVLPANLMVAEAVLCILVGFALVVIGFWPVVFSDSAPSAEEFADTLRLAFTGGLGLIWGALILIGASRMQNLGSYSWAVAGACIAVLPLLAGVFALVALQDERVKAGFREPESGPIGTEKDEDDEVDDEDDD